MASDSDEKAAASAVLTIVVAATFFSTADNATDLERNRCFTRAEEFVDKAMQRYGKELGLT